MARAVTPPVSCEAPNRASPMFGGSCLPRPKEAAASTRATRPHVRMHTEHNSRKRVSAESPVCKTVWARSAPQNAIVPSTAPSPSARVTQIPTTARSFSVSPRAWNSATNRCAARAAPMSKRAAYCAIAPVIAQMPKSCNPSLLTT